TPPQWFLLGRAACRRGHPGVGRQLGEVPPEEGAHQRERLPAGSLGVSRERPANRMELPRAAIREELSKDLFRKVRLPEKPEAVAFAAHPGPVYLAGGVRRQAAASWRARLSRSRSASGP